ncbi:MAG: hypothetical protein AAB402_01120 [Patescibacteria group bacterium]
MTTINTISGQAIRMPSENADWFFTFLYFDNHLAENFPTGTFRAFTFNKLFGNGYLFSLGIFGQLKELCLNGHDLMFFILG